MIVKQAHIFKNKFLAITYSTVLACFAVISIYFAVASVFGGLNVHDNSWAMYLDILIWFSFTVDYFYRFNLANNKKEFIKNNIWDAMAIVPIPFLNIFWSNQFIDILRMLRVVAFIDELRDGMHMLAAFKEVAYAFYFFGIVIIGSSFGIYFTEKTSGTVTSVWDAVWWSFVTSTTVGYGDISPKTLMGRIIAILLMILGTALLNILTAALVVHFVEKAKKNDRQEELKGDLDNDGTITINVRGLSPKEVNSLLRYIKILKEGD